MMCRHGIDGECAYCKESGGGLNTHTRDVASFCEQRQQRHVYARVPVPKGRYGGKHVGRLYSLTPSDRRSGTSNMVMPNGSVVCLAHDAPFVLGASMSVEIIRGVDRRAKRHSE